MQRAVAKGRLAPAKINLALHVTGRRPDGYHLVETVVVFAELGDYLTVAPAERDTLDLHGAFAGAVPRDPTNLVLKARDMLRSRMSGAAHPVAIALEKNLPVAAGVGGGSSDAAATLKLLASLWGADASSPEIAATALRLGADVPMCLHAQALLARGIGEEIQPIADFPELALVLVNPGPLVPTQAVFAALESRNNEPLPPQPSGGDASTWVGWLGLTRNDLEAAACALVPEIRTVLKTLDGAGARLARMSGSGATCFGLFDNGEHAAEAARRLGNEHPDWFVRSTTAR